MVDHNLRVKCRPKPSKLGEGEGKTYEFVSQLYLFTKENLKVVIPVEE